MYRPDGSIASFNDPIEQGVSVVDHGLYKAQIIGVSYSDDTFNKTKDEIGPQVLYKVRIIGGMRDGQIFSGATQVQSIGGITNNSEIVLKKTTTITGADPASPLNPNKPSSRKLNGDVVYIQFLNGNPHYPIILGGAKHASNETTGSTKSEGQRYKAEFNGIHTEIDKDGKFVWSKDKGAYSSAPATNAQGIQVWDQFVSTSGFEDMFKLEMDNTGNMQFNILNGSTTLNFGMDGSTGLITLGNNTGDILQYLRDLVLSLSLATYAGFGAPGSNQTELQELYQKILLITG